MSRMVPEVAGKALGKKGMGYGKLVTEWSAIIGSELAAVSKPIKLAFPKGERSNATLTIDVLPARAVELQHMLPQLIERVNATFGYAAVSHIRMVQRPPEAKRLPGANLRPLSPVEERDLLDMTSLIPDGELRLALEGLGRAVQGRKDH